jgi:hypothetical protein
MMAQISVHNDDKLADRMLQPVNIRCSETEFLFSRSQDDFIRAIDLLKLFCDFQSSIR